MKVILYIIFLPIILPIQIIIWILKAIGTIAILFDISNILKRK